ncbi:DODA-type extradiol aromatic ring-opening family dioxygenase [Aestuariirhabdus litorea]|uniref:Dioxygenase n=1 Tax=Aestuariirhabdus litorea TaxID=2528527 RepID=A0A3P3VNV4_9GAMM|nr:class III extradiol ring-cleavage dioxygenase [Aestuariirhabdus litorea]RRJ83389.1 dioxygenase [Aestuariirhabdus litorea]RWW93549.1 dioxygenase [Endozoicomonadaceae bacterium GTF-13]
MEHPSSGNIPRVLYLAHGGGPLPLLGDEGHREMVATLASIRERLERPSLILVISAHWETPVATLTAGAAPPLLYDYYGFPPEAYRLQYPAPGAPEWAARLQAQLAEAGVEVALDRQRGFDHGFFVPLSLLYPEADIPCLQLSLLDSLDPRRHIELGRALGRALAAIDPPNVLVVGSGMSFHNMRAFFASPSEADRAQNHDFERWLRETCSDPALSEAERAERLEQWVEAPGARYCHPREEHLLPLQLCYGVAGRAASECFELEVLNKKVSMYLW